MSIHVALNHLTHYRYDRSVSLSPQIVRLRPAPHCRTRILSYSLQVEPAGHFINWQQDPQANYLARLVFPEQTREFQSRWTSSPRCRCSTLRFFLAPHAEQFPFTYEAGERRELAPYLVSARATPLFEEYLAGISARSCAHHRFSGRRQPARRGATSAIDPAGTGGADPGGDPAQRSGSCRDSAALLVQLLRHLGLAARFVSGYLIQLVPDVKSLDGPVGADAGLHRSACLVRGVSAGRRLDRSRSHLGLLAGEGHIPLACTPGAFRGGAGQRRCG